MEVCAVGVDVVGVDTLSRREIELLTEGSLEVRVSAVGVRGICV